MSGFAPIDPASGEAAEWLAQVQKALSLTPNMTKAMANSPALLKGYLAVSGALSSGVLRSGVRERLAIGTARRAGVTDAETREVIGHLALNVLTNHFNVLADDENDRPVVKLAGAAA